jgi:L-cysteine S-thiosulfotransferase
MVGRQRLRRDRDRFHHRLLKAVFLAVLWFFCVENTWADDRRSGYDFMSRETRAMQDDDIANPATLWVLDGEALWNRKAGASNKACAECHASGMKGVAARYPTLHKGKLVNLGQRINACRVEQQKAVAFEYETRDLLALTAYVGRQSRGLPIDVSVDDKKLQFEKGREFFFRRQGQLNMACSQCHDEQAGKRLVGNVIPQAHPTGYPIYRLEWQAMGSLHRRFRNCLTGIRAENYALGSPEFVELELYLMDRARGMKIETPAVRP